MDFEHILRTYHTIAVVGASRYPDNTSVHVMDYLDRHGYHVIPVNPLAAEISGKKCYPSLAVVPEKIDIVNIFQQPGKILPTVRDAINIGAKVVWLQEGVINVEAEAMALAAGLIVVMDKCIMKEHKRLAGQVKEQTHGEFSG